MGRSHVFLVGMIAAIALIPELVKLIPKSYDIHFGNKAKIRIPHDISDSKDCKKYYEFLDKEGLFLIAPDCPWGDVKPIGFFEINGHIFRIPREYLYFRPKQPSGAVESITMLVSYPDMKATNKKAFEEGRELLIGIAPGSVLHDGKEKGLPYNTWKTADGLLFINFILDGTEENRPVFIKHDSMLGLDLYNKKRYVNTTGDYDYYVKGEILKPEYWLICDKFSTYGVNPGCESNFMFNDDVKVKYTFRRKALLSEHVKVRERVERFIQERYAAAHQNNPIAGGN